LSSDVNWTTHIDNITTSALKHVYVLRKLKFTLSKKEAARIVTGLRTFSSLEVLYFETGWET